MYGRHTFGFINDLFSSINACLYLNSSHDAHVVCLKGFEMLTNRIVYISNYTTIVARNVRSAIECDAFGIRQNKY